MRNLLSKAASHFIGVLVIMSTSVVEDTSATCSSKDDEGSSELAVDSLLLHSSS